MRARRQIYPKVLLRALRDVAAPLPQKAARRSPVASRKPTAKHKTQTSRPRARRHTTNVGIARDAVAPRARPRAWTSSRRAARRADPPRVATLAPPQALAHPDVGRRCVLHTPTAAAAADHGEDQTRSI